MTNGMHYHKIKNIIKKVLINEIKNQIYCEDTISNL